MCGIAGWVAGPAATTDDATLVAMLATLIHRGPDGAGSYAGVTPGGDRVFLGHRRLAIIDVDGAHQPMCDDGAGLALVFNGEIYNFRELRSELAALGYRFKLDSDTEVLLRAYQHWGLDAVEHLQGMFAFVLWDAPRARLVLARDRFGEKPLFLWQSADGLYFASEIKALLQVPGAHGRVNLDAVWDYLSYRYVPGPQTLVTGIRKLPPGTCAVWEGGVLREQRYWSPPDRWRYRGAAPAAATAAVTAPPAAPAATSRAAPGADVVPAFLGHLDEAVRSHMVSDVPFGAFLSGGLDSSMIVALMTRHSNALRTFSVGFGDPRYSELPHAARVAAQFGTTHQEIIVSHRDMIDALPKLVAFRDAPVSEPSDIPIYLMAQAASRSVKMVLTGEGSDEILGGYPKHVFERLAGAWQLVPRLVRHRLIAPLVAALPYRFRRVKTAVTNLNIENRAERFVRWFGALNHAERERLAVLGLNGKDAGTGRVPFDTEAGNSRLRSMLYFDQTSWLPDNLLERGDRMTMAASIESRVPFLDHRLAEFVSALPDRYRVKGLGTKWLLREAGRQILPAAILRRPKVGFRVPVNQWLQGEMRDFLLAHLQDSASLTRGYYEARQLDRVLAEHLDGRQNHEKLLWSLLNLEIWHRQYAQP